MKKYILYLLTLLTILFLSACSNSAQPKEENDVQSIKDVAIKVPENIFSSSKKNENISENEMKQNIKNYIDYSWELSEILSLSLQQILIRISQNLTKKIYKN